MAALWARIVTVLGSLIIPATFSLENQFQFRDRRQGEFAQSLTTYHVSIPTRVNEYGDHVTHSLRHFLPAAETESRRRRRRREATSGSGSGSPSVHYKVNVEGDDVILHLTPNDDLFSPGLVFERRSSSVGTGNLTGVRGRRVPDNRCHFVGQVKGHPQSAVAIATCDGLHGLIRFKNRDYLIEPVKGHDPSEVGGHPHLIYRRSSLAPQLHPHERHKQREDDARGGDTCGVTEDESSDLDRLEKRKGRTVEEEGGRRSARRKRSISIERHVETLVVVDQHMMEFYRNDNIENYVLTIMNMVSTMYHDSSIGNAINIDIVKIMFLESEEKGLKITHHADHTLSSFCKWQMGINPSTDSHPNHHDVAILLTRMNICSRMNEPCSTLGLSQVSGLCQPHRSCNINEDTGLALAFTVAHELGHNFGMKHDTAEAGCEAPTEGMQFVMAPQLTAEASPLVWSNCSQTAVTVFLDRDWGHCLDDAPSGHEFSFPFLPPGVMYDIDHQCRLQYGPEAEYCDGIDNLCTTVWCRVDKKCMTKLEAAAEGTICGDSEWCFGGRCVTIGEKPEAIDSQWGEWSAWSQCTRTCGAGVSYSERLCNNPPPSHGGSYCLGERRRHRICSTKDCPSNVAGFREQQCSDYNDIIYKGQRYQWEPVFIQGAPCQLHCKPKGRDFSVMMRDMVIDGTPCVIGRKDMCISGRCRIVGCDWGIESDAKEDRCGVCHGDGSTCKTVKENFSKETGLGYEEAAVIPMGARNIRVEETAETNNYLAIRNDDGTYYLNGQWYIQWTGDYEAGGTVIQYRRDGNKENFVVPGPTKEALHVMLLFQSRNPGISVEYTVPDENITDRRRPEFHWKYSDWTHCTASCGGGNQVSEVVCVEKEAGIVEDTNCDSRTRPDDMKKPCNGHLCPAKWWFGPWQHCSVSCGEGGTRKRTVLCVRPLGPNEQIALEDWECDGLGKPNDSMPCRRRELCAPENSQWQTGPWIGKCETEEDPCSGSQKRLVTCLDPSGECETKGKPPSERPCPNTNCGKWIVSAWNKCTRSCDGGTQHRSVTCVGGVGCNRNEKPGGDQSCNMHECPRDPVERHRFYSNDALQEIPESIPSKIPDYEVLFPVDDSVSVTEKQPLPAEVVETPEVTTYAAENATSGGDDVNATVISDAEDRLNDSSSHNWMSHFWSECSKLCGPAFRRRKVLCIRVTSKEIVPDEYCIGRVKPVTEQECQNPPCGEWSTTPWEECTAKCGEGVQRRNVTCPPDIVCDPDNQPISTMTCDGGGPCAQWKTELWNECSVSCGQGVQQRAVHCIDPVTLHSSDVCDPHSEPSAHRECNARDCSSASDGVGEVSAACDADVMPSGTCHALRRMGKCTQVYVQRKCCHSCRQWQRTQGAAPVT